MAARGLTVCLALCSALAAGPSRAAVSPREAAADSLLGARRTARRASVRLATAAAKTRGAAAVLPLLVIPVDFADARLPSGWEAQSELTGPLSSGAPTAGTSLADYFRVASAHRAEVTFRIAPLVHLAGTRLDYSDVGLNGFTRSRRLAMEALVAARDGGIAFRWLDNDGPDGQPGTADDDGELDGVLILHSDVGDENDADAPIQALQYYLAAPVFDRGVAARSYAVASLTSGLGIWAHETAHLFGLEDRYDPYLASAGGDLAGRGGLGIFSLMAAGAYGTGAGHNPALLDAYSAAQIGWCDVRPYRGRGGLPDTLRATAVTGVAWRVWTHGDNGSEWFLLESRGGTDGPWDQNVPPHQLLVYHCDAALPEYAQSSSDLQTRHLRVTLVEADGDGALRTGLDRGGAGDLFPGTAGVTAWTPATTPSTNGYAGPTEIAVTGIASLADGVAVTLHDAAAPGFRLDFEFLAVPEAAVWLRAIETGTPVEALTADVVALDDTPWGSFFAGADSVRLTLARDDAGVWTPAPTAFWTAFPDPPAGAATRFRIRLRLPGGPTWTWTRTWVWSPLAAPLDFAGTWPGGWTTVDRAPASPGTAWQRWSGPGTPTADGSPLLVCTGSAFTSPTAWPDVRYGNGADIALVSPPLAAGTAAVRLVHAIDGELAQPGVAYDGGVVEFLGGDGNWLPAIPLDGYGGEVAGPSLAGLHGRPAFAGEDSATAAGPALWRVDVVPVPAAAARPVRLALRFAADDRFRGRGWLVARLELTASPAGGSAFPLAWIDSRLVWNWAGEAATSFRIDLSADNGATWREIYAGLPTSGAFGYAYAVLFDPANLMAADAKRLPPVPLVRTDRYLFRVVAETALGSIVSRARPFYPGGVLAARPQLGAPRPNPGRGPIVVPAIALYEGTRLLLCDLAGRVVRAWTLPAGEQTVTWDGRDGQGRGLPSGSYFFLFPATRGTGDALQHAAVVRRAVLLH